MHAIAASVSELSAWVGLVMWPFVRIAAMFSVAPLFGSQTIPVRIRVAAALTISVALAPSLPIASPPPPLSPDGVLAIATELLIGLSMGFMLQLVFSALYMAGELVATTMGLGMAQMTDPVNGVQVPVLGQLFFMTGMLLFLAMNGHLALLAMLLDSFRSMPVGAAGPGPGALWQLLVWAGNTFASAVQVALPAVTALLAANVMLGVITRSAPQLNLFAFGLPITTLLGLAMLLLVLPGLTPSVAASLESVLSLLATVFNR